MTVKKRVRGQGALQGIALWVLLASPALAQPGPPDAGAGECTPSREPHECAERCPSYDTCFIDEGDDGQLFYRVGSRQFSCAGLDCNAASQSLGDYCCARGEFAPSSRDEGGGCSVAGSRPRAGERAPAATAAAGLGALALAWARRRRPAR